MEKIIIIGGGVAGLSCLNALLDRGVSALLLEATTIGTPKMCGEFLAPPALSQLASWQIPVENIKQARFFVKNKNVTLTFPTPAGALARGTLEKQLAERARLLGGKILENTSITNIIPATSNTPYLFHLESGETLQTHTAIFATGKFNHVTNTTAFRQYAGIKFHFPHIINHETLLMYSMQNAYFGIVPISKTTSNCTCLIKSTALCHNLSPKDHFLQLIKSNSFATETFKAINMDNLTWLEGYAPEFGLKKLPNWPNALWIGDALASIYPAVGYGFAHSVENAVLAAEAYLHSSTKHYAKSATQAVKKKIRTGKLLHEILLHPNLGMVFLPLLRQNPWITKLILKKMGY